VFLFLGTTHYQALRFFFQTSIIDESRVEILWLYYVENEQIDSNAQSLLHVKTLTSYFYQDGTLVYFLLLMAKLLLLVFYPMVEEGLLCKIKHPSKSDWTCLMHQSIFVAFLKPPVLLSTPFLVQLSIEQRQEQRLFNCVSIFTSLMAWARFSIRKVASFQ